MSTFEFEQARIGKAAEENRSSVLEHLQVLTVAGLENTSVKDPTLAPKNH